MVGRGREAAERRLRLHHGRALLARGPAGPVRRDAAHLLQLHARDVRRRLWTTLATWSLLIPAVGMGMVVQNAATPYWVFLLLALLCGLGGGNFASSMANISFFFPKAEKGNALAINAGSAISG